MDLCGHVYYKHKHRGGIEQNAAATQRGGFTKTSWMGYPLHRKPMKVESKDDEVDVQRALHGKGLPCLPSKPKPSVTEEPKQVDLPKPIFTVDITTMMCTMINVSADVPDQSAPLVAGPENLLVAKFGETVHTTELCNLMLIAALPKKVKKKPAAAEVLKRPARAAAPVASDAAPAAGAGAEVAAAAPMAAAPKNDYGIEYYNTDNRNSIGIRAKFGARKQVLSFGSTRCTKTEKEMREIAAVVVADLHTGMSLKTAKKKGNRLAGLAK